MMGQEGEVTHELEGSLAPDQPVAPPTWARLTGSDLGVSLADRRACGKEARGKAPRSSHAIFSLRVNRPDPIDLLQEQTRHFVPELVSVRYGRMLASPFAYFRGSALAMASDLAATPKSELTVQLCGDAHLSNFGIFMSSEDRLFFDMNDFDETTPGPWEWDVKRLAASIEVFGRDNGFDSDERAETVRGTVRSYHEAMTDFSLMSMLDVWHSHLGVGQLLPRFHGLVDPGKTSSTWHELSKAGAHDSHQPLDRLVEAGPDGVADRFGPTLCDPPRGHRRSRSGSRVDLDTEIDPLLRDDDPT